MPIKGKKNTLWLKHLTKQEKLTNLIERLKSESELKFTMSGGNVFHKFTMRSVKNSLFSVFPLPFLVNKRVHFN